VRKKVTKRFQVQDTSGTITTRYQSVTIKRLKKMMLEKDTGGEVEKTKPENHSFTPQDKGMKRKKMCRKNRSRRLDPKGEFV